MSFVFPFPELLPRCRRTSDDNHDKGCTIQWYSYRGWFLGSRKSRPSERSSKCEEEQQSDELLFGVESFSLLLFSRQRFGKDLMLNNVPTSSSSTL